ncbi:MAG: arginine--tRNA ligase [Oscillospiraceae bacterium]|nr:arginine--tRNA ligase [Oscillospiraceae bacterium]
MTDLIKDAQSQLRELILNALGRLVCQGKISDAPLSAFNIEIPADRNHGDFSSNVAMASARALKMAPRAIAELIASEIDLKYTYFEKCEIAGPGFMNFFLSPQWFSDVVSSIEADGEGYGRTDYGQNKRVLVEFVSANPTGPMHIGNARGGAIGDCLSAVLDFAGYYVEREFYINDAGNQIEKFGNSLECRYLQLFDDSIEMPEDCYLGSDITDHAKAFAEINGDSYVNADSASRKKALVDFALPKNIAKLKTDLLKYRIEYDTWFKESTLHNEGKVSEIVELFKSKGLTYEQDGAVWFKSTLFGDDKDRVLMRSNGLPTYVVPDIAYHYNKLVTRNFDIAINVLGADHHGYIGRMKAAISALDIDPSRLDVVIMQMVNLVRDGETYKLSKRSGKAVTLETLLDEIPVDAARFFFNLREANSHFNLDLDLAVEQSSQNPVYYVQYAHARICSIIRNLEAEGISAGALTNDMLARLSAPQERALIFRLAQFPDEINCAAKDYDPSAITRYSIEIATLFHKFYDACRVKGDDTELTLARLALCKAVKTVICNILTMFKIDCPERM